MTNVDAAAVGAEIETLVAKLDAMGDSPVKAQAQELVRLLMALYGAGLSRVIDVIRTERGGPQAIFQRFTADPLVASLLALHDLHPDPIETRVQRALAALQPHLPAAARVTLRSADREAVRVAVEWGGPHQSRGGDTLRVAIERAIREAAPELTAVHVDGLDAPLIQIVRPAAAVTPDGAQ